MLKDRDLNNVDLTAEAGKRQVANSATAVVAMTNDDMRKLDDLVFRRGGNGIRSAWLGTCMVYRIALQL